MPAIRLSARNRSWGPRTLGKDVRIGRPMPFYSYAETPSATFWGGVEETVTVCALPILDRSGEVTAVAILTRPRSAGGTADLAAWTIADVGYPQWEAVSCGVLYRKVQALRDRVEAELGSGAVTRVVVTDGAIGVLGQAGERTLFGYVGGSVSWARAPGGVWQMPGLGSEVVTSGADAIAFARALAHTSTPPWR